MQPLEMNLYRDIFLPKVVKMFIGDITRFMARCSRYNIIYRVFLSPIKLLDLTRFMARCSRYNIIYRVFLLPPPIKLIATLKLKYSCKWR